MKKIALVFGGKSAEHEVSLRSAASVYGALLDNGFDVTLIWVSLEGIWHHVSSILNPTIKVDITASLLDYLKAFDSVFPVLHGPFGEDGTVQGLFRIAGVPFVGSDVMATAICMDKEISKRLLKEAGLHVADFICLKEGDVLDLRRVTFPCFVKPANMGSSIGISKVSSAAHLQEKIDLAFEYDAKVIIEKAMIGDEVECAILGNKEPIASLPARLICTHEFYTYEAKYIDSDGFETPAKYPPDLIAEIQDVALKAYKTLGCAGMARVDMFVLKDKIVVSEVNTIPGFTSISQYPKMWEVSGLCFKDLVARLIDLSLEEALSKNRNLQRK
jgi:D-alanine-D-alanine ligase